MRLWAIRHIPSGKYLPDGRYPTRHEPTHYKPPRLFTVKSSAAKALHAWSLGVWYCSDGLPEPVNHTNTFRSYNKIERRKEDLEVVEMILMEREDPVKLLQSCRSFRPQQDKVASA
jgi:hypothetical protein